jgi:hypothetical protein
VDGSEAANKLAVLAQYLFDEHVSIATMFIASASTSSAARTSSLIAHATYARLGLSATVVCER